MNDNFNKKKILNVLLISVMICSLSIFSPIVDSKNIDNFVDNKKDIKTNLEINDLMIQLFETFQSDYYKNKEDIYKLEYNDFIKNNIKIIKGIFEDNYNFDIKNYFKSISKNIDNNDDFESDYFEEWWNSFQRYINILYPLGVFYYIFMEPNFELEDWFFSTTLSIYAIIPQALAVRSIFFIFGAIIWLLMETGSGLELIGVNNLAASIGRTFMIYMIFAATNLQLDLLIDSVSITINVQNPYNEPLDGLVIKGNNIDIPKDFKGNSEFSFIGQDNGYYTITLAPPGIWNISIPPQHNYNELKNSTTSDIESMSTYLEGLTICRDHPYIFQNIPIKEQYHVELNPLLIFDIIDYQNDSFNVNIYIKEVYDENWTLIYSLDNQSKTTFVFPAPQVDKYNTEYNWKIVAKDENNNIEEKMSSFTTKPQP